MTPTKYQELANRTMWKPSKTYSELELTILYNAMGLAGEVGELSELLSSVFTGYRSINLPLVTQEIGDIFWYMSALCTKLDLSFSRVIAFDEDDSRISKALFDSISQLSSIASGSILDYVKKGVFHDHGIDPDVMDTKMHDLAGVLFSICKVLEINPTTVMELNIEKLRSRYPDGFDVEASKNRDDRNKKTSKLLRTELTKMHFNHPKP